MIIASGNLDDTEQIHPRNLAAGSTGPQHLLIHVGGCTTPVVVHVCQSSLIFHEPHSRVSGVGAVLECGGFLRCHCLSAGDVFQWHLFFCGLKGTPTRNHIYIYIYTHTDSHYYSYYYYYYSYYSYYYYYISTIIVLYIYVYI